MLEPFRYAFVQRGLVEVLLLSVGAGLLGTWIVLRGLSFFSHAVGTAAFPGLVLADGLGFSAFLGAVGATAVFALGVERLARGRHSSYDSLTALVLVGALAGGVILASDVFHSGANVETLLFGSLLVVGDQDLLLAGIASAAALLATLVAGRRWLAIGFDASSARSLGVRPAGWDALLLGLIAFSVISALSAIGALLVTALFVVPAATVRLWTRRLPVWQLASVGLVAVEGTAGLWLSVKANVPPGAAIAVLGGAVFALAALVRWAWQRVGMRGVLALSCGALLVVAASGCGGDSNDSGAGAKLDVVATTTQIGDWVRQVGGDAVAVHQLLQPNSDPHEYEPRPADVEATSGAKVVFENGDNLDAWMGKVVDQAGGSPTVVVLGNAAPIKRAGETSGPEASKYDPHWWHDPRNAEAAVTAISKALSAADPDHGDQFSSNADAYVAKLKKLDSGIAACINDVPKTDRKLVTDHDAFGYFADRYGITVVGAVIPSQTTQAQPSAGETADLIKLIRAEGVKAVFPESSVNAKLAQTIAKETGATADYTLYGDTLGPAGSSGATYLSMEQANADAMTRGFTGGTSTCTISGIG